MTCITIFIEEIKFSIENNKEYDYYIKSIYNLLEGKNKIKDKMIMEIIDL